MLLTLVACAPNASSPTSMTARPIEEPYWPDTDDGYPGTTPVDGGRVTVVRVALAALDGAVELEDGTDLPSAPDDQPFGDRDVVVALGDVDGDGVPDLGVPSRLSEDGRISVFSGAGVDTSTPPLAQLTFPYPPDLSGVGDLDGDGLAELVTVDSSVYRLWSGASLRGALSLADSTSDVENQGSDGALVRVGDLDGDGREDLLLDTSFGPRILPGALLLGDEPFRAEHAFFPSHLELPKVHTSVLGDVDGDGLVDVMSSVGRRSGYDGPVEVYLLSGRDLASGVTLDEDDAFAHLSLEGTYAAVVEGVGLGDLDGDGLGEAVIAGHLFAGRALVDGPSWAEGDLLGTDGLACDVDGDGLRDLVGDGIFLGAELGSGGASAWASSYGASACAGDLDGDGAEELAFASESG